MKKEKPILFNGDMVRAILDGRKTQTRRLSGLKEINNTPNDWIFTGLCEEIIKKEIHATFTNIITGKEFFIKCPYGRVGDELWVRETHAIVNGGGVCIYRANWHEDALARGLDNVPDEYNGKWTPSIFMRRELSRIQLKITDVRVERLHDITREDAKSEGLLRKFMPTDGFTWYGHDGKNWNLCPITMFKSLWQSINGNWDDNPWVWCISFEVIKNA